jgi:predicted nucleic acid-binding protein
MTEVWLDTNVLLRFITREPPEQARAARRLMARAASGDLVVRLDHLVLAEAIWVLGSFYGRERAEIADAIRSFVLADGVTVEDADVVIDALRSMSDANVAFVDSYLAARSRQDGRPIASFDANFRRLGVEIADLD